MTDSNKAMVSFSDRNGPSGPVQGSQTASHLGGVCAPSSDLEFIGCL